MGSQSEEPTPRRNDLARALSANGEHVTVTPFLDPQSAAPSDVTIIICTYNRCNVLAGTLANVAALEMPSDVAWDVLVVDNNSTDQTREVVAAFHRENPRFHYLFEPGEGKSRALNAGIANAGGKVLAFLDDDVTVEPTWLNNLTSGLRTGEWVGAGGRILPAGSFTLPDWLPPRNFPALFGHFDLGDQPGQLLCPPYGSNMAFRKTVFEKYGGFRTDLGPSRQPTIPRKNEDTEFGCRVINAGERLRYEPSAVVYHPILPERLTEEYFREWWFEFGRARARELGKPRDLYGIPGAYVEGLRYLIRIVRATTRWVFSVRRQNRIWHQGQAWRWAGHVVELWRLGRERAKDAEVAAALEKNVGSPTLQEPPFRRSDLNAPPPVVNTWTK